MGCLSFFFCHSVFNVVLFICSVIVFYLEDSNMCSEENRIHYVALDWE